MAMDGVRLRQLVIVSDNAGIVDELQDRLGLGDPFVDPGVGEFGLTNAVFAIGDQFLEVVIPVSNSAPAKRFLDHSGKGGYMVIFQVPDIAAARQRVDNLGVRRVWDIDLHDISASHLHPADIGGTIVSIDTPVPAEAWRWGGPDWPQRSVKGGIVGATLSSATPIELASKWASALGIGVEQAGSTIETDGERLQFEVGEREGFSRFHLVLPSARENNGACSFAIGSLELIW
ncbi:MAG: VOC family protein [Pseudomonadota bacterium]